MRRAIPFLFVIAGRAEAEPTGSLSVGAGYSPDEELIATVRVAQDSLFHTGQRLSLDASLSKLREHFGVDYALPMRGGLELRTQLYYDRREHPGFRREAAGVAVQLGEDVAPHARVAAQVRAERVDKSLTIVAAGAGATYDTRDSAIPRRGTRIDVYGEAADPRLGSDVAMWRVRGELAHAEALGPLTVRYAERAEYVGGDVPRSERLYFGGNRDVRGYGISDEDRGASLLASGHLELEAPLLPHGGLALAGFADTGFSVGETSLLRRSYGASLIWRSPIGPLRLDYAIPLDGAFRKPRFLFWAVPGA